jgi:hypothetical protein
MPRPRRAEFGERCGPWPFGCCSRDERSRPPTPARRGSRQRLVGVYVGRLGLVGAACARKGSGRDSRTSSSSVLQAKSVSTPRSRASAVTLAGGLTAAVSGTTTQWVDGWAGVDDWEGAAWAVLVAAARVVATAKTARRRGLELMLVRPPSWRPQVRAGRSEERPPWRTHGRPSAPAEGSVTRRQTLRGRAVRLQRKLRVSGSFAKIGGLFEKYSLRSLQFWAGRGW